MMKSRCKKTTPPKGKTKKKVGFQRKEKSKKNSPPSWNPIKKQEEEQI